MPALAPVTIAKAGSLPICALHFFTRRNDNCLGYPTDLSHPFRQDWHAIDQIGCRVVHAWGMVSIHDTHDHLEEQIAESYIGMARKGRLNRLRTLRASARPQLPAPQKLQGSVSRASLQHSKGLAPHTVVSASPFPKA
jgi:hypothetical protein